MLLESNETHEKWKKVFLSRNHHFSLIDKYLLDVCELNFSMNHWCFCFRLIHNSIKIHVLMIGLVSKITSVKNENINNRLRKWRSYDESIRKVYWWCEHEPYWDGYVLFSLTFPHLLLYQWATCRKQYWTLIVLRNLPN